MIMSTFIQNKKLLVSFNLSIVGLDLILIYGFFQEPRQQQQQPQRRESTIGRNDDCRRIVLEQVNLNWN